MLIRLFAAIFDLFEHLGPALNNLFYGYLAYQAVENHTFSLAAGAATYLVLNEFDSIKRHFVIYGYAGRR